VTRRTSAPKQGKSSEALNKSRSGRSSEGKLRSGPHKPRSGTVDQRNNVAPSTGKAITRRRRINPRNKPGPKPKDPVAHFERMIRREMWSIDNEDEQVAAVEDVTRQVQQGSLAISELSAQEKHRIAYALHEFLGWTYADIAETLGWARFTSAASAVQRVKRQLDRRNL
jgi:DNA-directed RNA polymerase specialized sigma24 family protein